MRRRVVQCAGFGFLGLCALTACGAGDELDLGPELEQPSVTGLGRVKNGPGITGVTLTGSTTAGASLSGTFLEAVRLDGVTKSGRAVTGVTLEATAFSSTSPKLSRTGFASTTWTGELSNGETIPLRVDSVTKLHGDIYAYGVSYQASGGWLPLCPTATTLAIPVNGTWDQTSGTSTGGRFTNDATRFTFGCREQAIATCVELGYKPWKAISGGTLQGHHLACVRMIRADYCGDGDSWTTDGTLINVYDGVRVQDDTEAWNVEAEWTTAGARCLSPLTQPRWQLVSLDPPCPTLPTVPGCGDKANFSTGTLLINEYGQ